MLYPLMIGGVDVVCVCNTRSCMLFAATLLLIGFINDGVSSATENDQRIEKFQTTKFEKSSYVVRSNPVTLRRLKAKITSNPAYYNAFHGHKVIGVASYYNNSLHGKITASGIPYDMQAYTAASAVLPIPSIVKVTNLKNKKSVYVLINDKGPRNRDFLIDLSQQAAIDLGFIRQGVAKVLVEYLSTETAQIAKNSRYYTMFGIKSVG
ncbi:Endolytic peptidoglycan transglycosylase RlpA [Alphaproteobacteria bacterium]